VSTANRRPVRRLTGPDAYALLELLERHTLDRDIDPAELAAARTLGRSLAGRISRFFDHDPDAGLDEQRGHPPVDSGHVNPVSVSAGQGVVDGVAEHAEVDPSAAVREVSHPRTVEPDGQPANPCTDPDCLTCHPIDGPAVPLAEALAGHDARTAVSS
jgi:hypothetical protein